jgi:hypothetical protein
VARDGGEAVQLGGDRVGFDGGDAMDLTRSRLKALLRVSSKSESGVLR